MKKVVIGAVLGLSSMPLMANENPLSLELLVGETTQEVQGSSGEEISFGIRGSFNFNQHLSFELAYQDYGEASWDYTNQLGDSIHEETETTAFNLTAKGILPIKHGFSVHARAGLSLWSVDIEINDSSLFPGDMLKGGDQGISLIYGVGAQYDISPDYTVGLEYTLAEYEVKPNRDLSGIKADLELDTLAIAAGINF